MVSIHMTGTIVADALSIYTDTFPFVCGHESLTAFVRVAMRRPLICKIHRDLLLGPQNDPRSLRRLHDAWGTTLRALFQHYTPLFIGYGGNDDTLMDLLESLQPGDIKGQMIWCYYEGGKSSERIVNVVTDLRGVLVPVPDFDLLMVLLGEKMGIGLLDEEVGRRAQERTDRYRERIQRLDTVKHTSVMAALVATLQKSGSWWAWSRKARAEQNLERRETIYRQGIELYPQSPELHSLFGYFMRDVRGNHEQAKRLNDKAEQLFRKALELDPKQPNNARNFAVFLTDVRGLHNEAEQCYRKALELDPNNLGIAAAFAAFLTNVRGLHDEAEQLFRKALELDPKQANNARNFALFLTDVRGLHDEAEQFFRKALELDPNDVNNTINYSEFLLKCGRLDEAAKKLERAKSLNDGKKNTLAAILALYAAILARAEHKDDNAAINELQTLLSDGFARTPWIFNQVLAFVKEKLSPQEHELFSVLAAAILDPKKVPDATLRLGRRSATPAVSREAKKAQQRFPNQRTASQSPSNGFGPEKSDGEGTLHASVADSGRRKKSRRN
jgi:protein O-mannosyl-transferase